MRPRRSRAAGALVLAGAALALAGAAHAQTPPAPAGAAGAVFGPRLLYYPLECHHPRDCRIDCFQQGVNVVSRLSISPNDTLHLVVNAGLADEIVPRWIEIRSFDESRVQTILLTPGTVCDLQSLTINALGAPRP